jgi:hypothetical protein
MKSMSTTSLRQRCLSSYLLSFSSEIFLWFCFPPQSPVGRPAQPPNRLCYSLHLVRFSSLHYSFILTFQILYISAFGPKIHRQGYGRTVKGKLMLTTGTTAYFISVKNFQKSCRFLKSPFGWRRRYSLCGKMLIVSLTLCSYKGRKNLQRGVLEASRLLRNVCTSHFLEKQLDYSILIP